MKLSPTLIAILAAALLAGSAGKAVAQTFPDDYEGAFTLKTPTGALSSPYWCYYHLRPDGTCYFNAAGAISEGVWHEFSPGYKAIVLGNAPFNSYIITKDLPFTPNGFDVEFVYFYDSWGNTLHDSGFWVFEN